MVLILKNDRSRESAKLLTWGLTSFDLIEIAKSNTSIENVMYGLVKKIQLELM